MRLRLDFKMAGPPALAAAAFAVAILFGAARPALAETYSLVEPALTEEEALSAKKSVDDSTYTEDSKDGVTSKDGTTYTLNQLNAKESSQELSVAVTDSGSNTVSFTFYNAGGDKSSITDIYLTGTGGLLEVPGKITDQSDGVSFSTEASSPNLPVGEKYDFIATTSAGSTAPTYENGVNSADEYVTWTFALADGATYDDVIKAIDSGKLQVGAFAPGTSGGSSSFTTGTSVERSGDVTAVPLPAALWLMIGALGSLLLMNRRSGRRLQYIDLMSASSWARPASSRLAT